MQAILLIQFLPFLLFLQTLKPFDSEALAHVLIKAEFWFPDAFNSTVKLLFIHDDPHSSGLTASSQPADVLLEFNFPPKSVFSPPFFPFAGSLMIVCYPLLLQKHF